MIIYLPKQIKQTRKKSSGMSSIIQQQALPTCVTADADSEGTRCNEPLVMNEGGVERMSCKSFATAHVDMMSTRCGRIATTALGSTLGKSGGYTYHLEPRSATGIT